MAGTEPVGGPLDCPLERVRGDSKLFRVKLTDSTGTAVDVTGYTGLWTIDTQKDPVDDATNVVQISGSPTGTPTDGIIEFSPSAMEMDITPGNYHYDVQITDLGGALNTILKSKIKIVQDLTKV